MKRPPPPKAPWAIAVRRALSDGEWHEREELLEVARKTVPPGIAYRRAEQHRIGHGPKAGPAQRRYGDEFSTVKAGAHRVANDLLRRLVHGGLAEREGDNYRLKPRYFLEPEKPTDQ